MAVLLALVVLILPAAAEARRNVIIVMTDDQPQVMSEPLAFTTRALGEGGTTFVNNFATQPLCCPSRATFLTGQYPHNHGVRRNDPPGGGYHELRQSETLPIWLRRDGYDTAYIGKFMNGYGDPDPQEVPPGWRTWKALTAGGRFYNNFHLNEDGKVNHYVGEYMTDLFADKAARYIRQNLGGRPFFLTIAPWAPHGEPRAGPPVPPDRYMGDWSGRPLPNYPSYNEEDVSDKPREVRETPRLDASDRDELQEWWRRGNESLKAVDDLVEDVVVALREGGELDNTLFIYTSDNGSLFGQHRLRKKNVIYEEAVRVPLMMRGPGVPAGARREQLVGNIDLAPTILDAVGATRRAGRPRDGQSLLPFAADPTHRVGRDLLFETGANGFFAVREPGWTYSRSFATGERELYDLETDPSQLESLDDDPAYQAKEAAMAARLGELKDCKGAECR